MENSESRVGNQMQEPIENPRPDRLSAAGERPDGFFWQLLEEFGGMGIKWEHRYYGTSHPSGNNRTWLTVDQALADIPAMAANFSVPRWSHIDLTPVSTPWIFVGGSYPGIRAAFSRDRYPNTFHAAWAASAPVQLRVDALAYFIPIIEDMKARGLPECLADIQAGTKRVDAILDSGSKSMVAALKNKFFENGANLTNGEFADSLTSLLWWWQDYLERFQIEKFCTFIETDPDHGNTTAPASGWAPIKGSDWVVDRMSKASSFYTPWSEENQEGFTWKSWRWQCCTELGFFQVSGPELHHLVGKYNSVEWQKEQCLETFPELSEMSNWPRSRALNGEFGGWHMRPSNTSWTTGQFDSWRSLQPLSGLSNAPRVTPSLEIPVCDSKLPEHQIFGHLLLNGSHISEFYGSDQAKMVQKVFTEAIHAWLPCFRKKSQAEITPYIPPKCT